VNHPNHVPIEISFKTVYKTSGGISQKELQKYGANRIPIAEKKHHSNYPIRSDSSIFQSSSSKSLERGTLSPVKYGDKSGITKQC
jgi:hypothetical protein